MKKRTKEAAAKILLKKGWTLEEANAVLVQSKQGSIRGDTPTYPLGCAVQPKKIHFPSPGPS